MAEALYECLQRYSEFMICIKGSDAKLPPHRDGHFVGTYRASADEPCHKILTHIDATMAVHELVHTKLTERVVRVTEAKDQLKIEMFILEPPRNTGCSIQ
jgi:hypothetical protein